MTADDIALLAQIRYEREYEREKNFAATLASIMYNGAALIGIAVNEPRKFPKIGDAFPGLFERKEQDQQDWRIMKQRMEDFAKAKKEESI